MRYNIRQMFFYGAFVCVVIITVRPIRIINRKNAFVTMAHQHHRQRRPSPPSLHTTRTRKDKHLFVSQLTPKRWIHTTTGMSATTTTTTLSTSSYCWNSPSMETPTPTVTTATRTTARPSIVLQYLIAGGISRALSQAILYPLDALRTLAQTRDQRSLVDVGSMALVRGCFQTSVFAIGIGSIQFAVIGIGRDYFGWNTLYSSALGAAASCLVSVP